MRRSGLMSWKTCLSEHVNKIRSDNDRALEIIKMAELRHSFWNLHKFDKKYASIVVEGYYEIIKELLTALFYVKGFKSSNHECLIAFFKEHYPELDYEAEIIYQFKNVRNDIAYRGFFVNQEYLELNKLEFEHIIRVLREIVINSIG